MSLRAIMHSSRIVSTASSSFYLFNYLFIYLIVKLYYVYGVPVRAHEHTKIIAG